MKKAFSDKIKQTASAIEEQQRKDELERKDNARQRMNDLQANFDVGMEKASLMANLGGIDDSLAAALAEDEELQNKRNAEKRALLLARRRNRNKQKQEEEMVKDKIELIQIAEEEKQKISEDYINELFKKKPGEKLTEADKEKKLQILNEYLSDQFLERSAGIMGKQFTEKEQMLKLLNQKYMDQQASEADAIKAQFKIDYEKLEKLKETNPETMTQEAYLETYKKL